MIKITIRIMSKKSKNTISQTSLNQQKIRVIVIMKRCLWDYCEIYL
jgi:hypothetical protein